MTENEGHWIRPTFYDNVLYLLSARIHKNSSYDEIEDRFNISYDQD
jgi:hypothetical protein